MSGKSIRFSIYAILLFAVCVLGIVYLFKFNILMGIAGVILLIFPVMLQKKAIDESSGKFDTIFAKFIVPALAIVITFLAIMSIALWIK